MAHVPSSRGRHGLPPSTQLVVFDFDLCVLRIHSFGQRLEPSDVAQREPLSADFFDLRFFAELVAGLVASGVRVAVASFGRADVIAAFLSRAFPGDAPPFSGANISTPATIGGRDGFSIAGGKNAQLSELSARYGVPPAGILFFDDDASNIAKALAGGFSCAIHCPEGFALPAWARGVERCAAVSGGGSSSDSAISNALAAAQAACARVGSALGFREGTGSGRTWVAPTLQHPPEG